MCCAPCSEYTATNLEDFAKALQDAADGEGYLLPNNVTIQQLIDSWGNQVGYPVVTVHRDYQKDTATVSQVNLKKMRYAIMMTFSLDETKKNKFSSLYL